MSHDWTEPTLKLGYGSVITSDCDLMYDIHDLIFLWFK